VNWDHDPKANQCEGAGFIFYAEPTHDPKEAVYTNQSGGYACRHPKEYGVLHQFTGPQKELLQEALDLWFVSEHGPWRGWCIGPANAPGNKTCTEVDAAAVDAALFTALGHCEWRVERERLGDCMEAWFYVKNIYTGRRAILFWENSD
jgi:hypothetical protein